MHMAIAGARLAPTSILTTGVWMHVVDGFLIASLSPSVLAEIGVVVFYTWSAMLYTVSGTVGTACLLAKNLPFFF